MNVHVSMTPTQAKLYQERKAREARMKAAAIRLKEKAKEQETAARSEAAWSDLRLHVLAIKAKKERDERLARERAEDEARKEAKRRMWRQASWRYMVSVAAEKARREAEELSFAERKAMFAEVPEPTITGLEILEQTARKYAPYGVTVNTMRSPRRTRGALIQARFEFYWRCREETGLSFPQIGQILGGKDHTTVLHGARMYQRYREEVMGGAKVYPEAAQYCGVVIPELVITESL